MASSRDNRMAAQERHPLVGLAGWAALVFVAAALGALASRDAPSFYGQLQLPGWAPSPAVFGPVWTILYVLMAFAAWLATRDRHTPRSATVLFIVQLVLNAVWSWLFFGLQDGALAFADVILLLVLVAATTVQFWRIRPLAGLLLVPYLAWVTFASVLTFAVWQGNPGML
jgi:tryptophan-rich sensory protein